MGSLWHARQRRTASRALWHDHRVGEPDNDPTLVGRRRPQLVPPPPAQVVEPDQPQRIRRQNDLIRLIVWTVVTAGLLLLGDVALGTTSGLERDLTSAITTLPDLILAILAFASNVLLVVLPPLILADLAIRRRWRTVAVAAAAGVVGWLAAYAFSVLGTEFLSQTLLDALTTGSARGERTPLAFPLLSAIAAMASVDGLRGRPRLAVAVWGSTIGFTILVLFDQSATPMALAVSATAGRVVGLAFRYAFGTNNPRPSGREVASALATVAVPLSYLEWDSESDDERRYRGITLEGEMLDVRVIDRDRRSAGLLYQLYRRLRVQGVVERSPTWSVRRAVDQAVLPVLAARRCGVRTPDLVAAASVTADAAVLAFEAVSELRVLSQSSAGSLEDARLTDLWEQVRTLHRHGIAHGELHADNIAFDEEGRVWLLGLENGEVAADAVTLRIDDAELLVTTALVIGADRAVNGALNELTAQRIGDTLPLLQAIALSRTNRKTLRQHRDLLPQLRDAVVAAYPAAPSEPVRLERMRPRTLFAFVGLTFAVTLLLSQLASINLVSIVTDADPVWVVICALASTLTYVAASVVITSLAPVTLTWARTFLTQLAATFVSLVAPAAVGNIGTNSRYLQQAGAPPAVAVASVGASQLFVFLSYIVLIIVFGVITGQQQGPDLIPDSTVLIVLAGAVGVAGLLLAVPVTRQRIFAQFGPLLRTTWPRLLESARQPRRIAMGVGGALLLNLSYALALFAAVYAYGGSVAFAAVGFVYLAAGAVGSAAPTPGGIGAVEAALAAGLTAAGLDGSVAVQAALLFRALTFWLPMVPGWLSFTYLQRVAAL